MQATISFRTKKEYKNALSKIANSQDRSVSFVINQAIANHLAYRKEVASIIKIGEQQIKDGKVSEEKEWRKLFIR